MQNFELIFFSFFRAFAKIGDKFVLWEEQKFSKNAGSSSTLKKDEYDRFK